MNPFEKELRVEAENSIQGFSPNPEIIIFIVLIWILVFSITVILFTTYNGVSLDSGIFYHW